MRVFLIRHGESLQNVKKPGGIPIGDIPDADVPITENGKKQARETGLKLRDYLKEQNISLDNARMWVSPYLRTVETAALVNEALDIKNVFEDPRIVEKDFGNFDGLSEEEWHKIDAITLKTMNKRYASERSRFFSRLPNGESPFDVYNRVSGFIETLFRDNNDPVFIVSHGATIRCFIMRWLHKSIKWYYNEPNPKNACIILIEKNNDKYDYRELY